MSVIKLWKKKKYKYEIGEAMGVVWNWKYWCKLMISKIYIYACVFHFITTQLQMHPSMSTL